MDITQGKIAFAWNPGRVSRFIRFLLKRSRNDSRPSVRDPQIVAKPRGHAILLRGFSWWNDPTFRRLESWLTGWDIAVKRFSYRGPANPEYEPIHCITDMNKLTEYLDDYVRGIPEGMPVYLFGHSFGGVVLANWICGSNQDNSRKQLLDRVNTFFLFAAPLFTPVPSFTLPEIRDDHAVLFEEGTVYVYAPADLSNLVNYSSKTVVIWSKNDGLVPKEMAVLSGRHPSMEPLDEIEVSSSHLDICNDDDAVKAVIFWTYW